MICLNDHARDLTARTPMEIQLPLLICKQMIMVDALLGMLPLDFYVVDAVFIPNFFVGLFSGLTESACMGNNY